MNVNELELDLIVESLQPFVGKRLVEVLICAEDLLLGFELEERTRWVWIDLNGRSLSLLPYEVLPRRIRNEKKPLSLFLKSHFIDSCLLSVYREKEYGRVLRFCFDGGRDIQVILFPGAKNIIATSSLKNICFYKPKSLSVNDGAKEYSGAVRSLPQLKEEWLELRKENLKSKNVNSGELERKRWLKKLNKSLNKTNEAISKLESGVWHKVATELQERQSLELSDELLPYVDKQQSLGWNIDRAFTKHAAQKAKLSGAVARSKELQLEIDKVESGDGSPQSSSKPKPKLMETAEAKGRRKKIAEGIFVSVGKSAKDNMNLLRRSKPWYVWLHLRDQPSAHGFVESSKKGSIKLEQVKAAAEFLVQTSVRQEKYGNKWEVMYCECRYVRPIKGDKLGRVHFTNEKSLVVSLDSDTL